MKKFIILFLFLVVIGGIMVSPLFRITRINVHNIIALSSGQVIGLINESENIFAFRSGRAATAIGSNPFVYRVTLSKNYLLREVNIYIIERETIGYIQFSEGQYLHVDNSGRVLAVSNEPRSQLPIAVGLNFSGFLVGEVLEALQEEAFYIMATLAGLFITYGISQNEVKINIVDTSNIRLIYGNIIVNLGLPQDLDEKIRILLSILPKVTPFRYIGGSLNIRDINEQWVFSVLT